MVGQRVCCASSAIPLFLTGFARKRQVCQCGATVAQLICNQWVAGSIPVTGSMKVSGSVPYGTGPVSYVCRNRTCEGASVKRTRSVRSERARMPAGIRSRSGFAKRIRGLPVTGSMKVSGSVPLWDRARFYLCRYGSGLGASQASGLSRSVTRRGRKPFLLLQIET